MRNAAQPGRVVWIGLRPGRRADMLAIEQTNITEDGLAGDRAKAGRRAVTLIQAEHLPAIGSYLGRGPVDPTLLRRNLVIEGINLLALRDRTITLGTATLLITGPCAPCSRMEETLGLGGYAAMRGHGGMTASVLTPGSVALGALVQRIGDA
ncbi:MAG: MOSC domain-containing protein [Devosiaceae bacterium]|nr:MOSC domain-containing protein [Devosiaceae bacterium MH13]